MDSQDKARPERICNDNVHWTSCSVQPDAHWKSRSYTATEKGKAFAWLVNEAITRVQQGISCTSAKVLHSCYGVRNLGPQGIETFFPYHRCIWWLCIPGMVWHDYVFLACIRPRNGSIPMNDPSPPSHLGDGRSLMGSKKIHHKNDWSRTSKWWGIT